MNEFDWVQSKEQKRKVLLAEQHGVEHGGKGQITKKNKPKQRTHTHTHSHVHIQQKLIRQNGGRHGCSKRG